MSILGDEKSPGGNTAFGSASPAPMEKEGGERSVGSSDNNTHEEDSNHGNENEQTQSYETGVKLALIMASLCAATFLVALDRTIIATAVPRITTDFHSLEDISWYASSYLITSCATQLLWGRIYTFYSTKTIFLIAIFVFEVGSAICGAAPTSTSFIIGRAIAGLGAAGIFSGSTVMLTHILPLQKRPMFIGLMGSMFGISSIIGPLMGGAFTDHVTWRWCFYINLPIGGAVFAILLLFLHVKHEKAEDSLSRQLIQLDPVGTVLFLPGIVCLLLALQWGGATFPWSNGRIISLFVVAGVLIIAFVGVQIWRQEDATIPPRIAKQRSVAFGTLFSASIGGGLISMLYNLPIWFQAVKGRTAVQSGIDTIPLVLSLVVGAIISGGAITRTGYYVPWMYVSTVLMAVGSGLTTTFKVNTAHPAWIGYQVLFGLGLGMGMQQPSLAAQNVLSKKDISTGVALMFFSQSLGGAIFVCIGQSVFGNYLRSNLSKISGVDVQAVIHAGATELWRVVQPDKLAEVLLVYNQAVRKAFIVTVAVASFMIVPTLGMEWIKIKKEDQSPQSKEQTKDELKDNADAQPV